MDRTRSALFTFATNFLVGYALGRLLKGRDAGVRAGMTLGTLGAVAIWRLTGRSDSEVVEPTSEPIEIEIDE